MRNQTADEYIDIDRDERAIIVGRTGSGKTTLARALVSQYPYVVATDPKGRLHLPHGRLAHSPAELFKQPILAYEPQIYRPDVQYWDLENWDKVFRWIYLRQNTTLFNDEIYGVMNGQRAPDFLQAIITRGRELGIRTISCTQRPTSIPLSIFTESDHYVMYPLQKHDDRRRMAEAMGDEVLLPLTEPFSFYYYRVGGQPAHKVILKLPEESNGTSSLRGQ